MQKRRVLIIAIVLAVVGALVYFQLREWHNFNWAEFWDQTRDIGRIHILHAVGLIYLAYVLRAIRWQVFLRPMKKVSWRSLVGPTIIGFTGLALLGRPGEFIRPYLIARRENLSVSSQIAVWFVERAFDIGAFFVLMTVAIISEPELRQLGSSILGGLLQRLNHTKLFHAGPLLVMAAAAVLAILLAMLVIRRLSDSLRQRIAHKAREFRMGLSAIRGIGAMAQLSIVSIAMWYVIALAYREVTHAYHVPTLQHMTISHVLVLMGSSMVGSMVQLPAVGGGSQAATIGVLYQVFGVPLELATSCGILLWLVTFVAVIPVGLVLAHRAHISLRQISAESAHEEAAIEST